MTSMNEIPDDASDDDLRHLASLGAQAQARIDARADKRKSEAVYNKVAETARRNGHDVPDPEAPEGRSVEVYATIEAQYERNHGKKP